MSNERFVVNRQSQREVINSATGQGLTPKGNWNNATIYAKGDVVAYSGNSYVCLVGNQNDVPPSNNWMLLVSGAGSPDWSSIVGKPDFDALYAALVHTHAWEDITGKPDLLTESRANTLYKPISYQPLWIQIIGRPSTFPPSAHIHTISDITSLQAALDSKAFTLHNHTIGQVDGLQTSLNGKADILHTHAIADITGLQTALDGKLTQAAADLLYRPIAYVPDWSEILNKPATFTPSAHTHAIADVTDLQTTLNGKSNVGHTHGIAAVSGLSTALADRPTYAEGALIYKPIAYVPDWSEITGKPSTFAPSAHTHPLGQLEQSGATNGQVPVWNGTAWAPGAAGSSLPAGSLATYLRHDGTDWLASALLKADIEAALAGGATIVGSGATRFILASLTPQTRGLLFRTGDGTASAQDRWLFSVSNEAESGSNNGSNFVLARYSDTGALFGTLIGLNRSTGNATFGGNQWTFITGNAVAQAGNFEARAGKFQGSYTTTTITNTGVASTALSLANHYRVLRLTNDATTGLTITSVNSFNTNSSMSEDYTLVLRNERTIAFSGSWLTVPSFFRFPASALADLPAGTVRCITFFYDHANTMMRCKAVVDTAL